MVASTTVGGINAAAKAAEGAAATAASGGVETYYRTMSTADFQTLKDTGKLPASTGETMVSPSLQYVKKYDGVTVQFNVQAGTEKSLMGIGVRNDAKGFLGPAYEGLPIGVNGWMSTSAYFKWERGVINIGLGDGSALNIFNGNIVNFHPVSK